MSANNAPRPHPSPLLHQRRRIVHVAPGTDMGGMEKLLVEFARRTDRQYFDLSFVSLEPSGVVASEIEALGWPVNSMQRRPGVRPSVVAKLAWLLRRKRAEIVHTHNTAGYLYGVTAAVLARVPHIIHTRHGQARAASSRQMLGIRECARFVDRVVCVSHDSHELSIRQGIPADRVETITNGIDVERFPFTGPAHGGPAVVVARLSPEKDVTTLLRATAIVVRRIPGFQLQIVGDGRCRSELENLASEVAPDGCVRFLGERTDVPALLSRGSMFVLPSLSEGISLALLEAMACGLPAIATRVGGNAEIIVDGCTGLLVPPADPSALADAVCRLHADPGYAHRIAVAGRQRVEQAFTVQRMVQAYENIYIQLATGRAPVTSLETGRPCSPARTTAPAADPRTRRAS